MSKYYDVAVRNGLPDGKTTSVYIYKAGQLIASPMSIDTPTGLAAAQAVLNRIIADREIERDNIQIDLPLTFPVRRQRRR